jgi:hypothetical protein
MGLFNSKKGGAHGEQTVLFDVWGQRGWPNIEVVGESHHAREIRALLPSRIDGEGTEAIVPVSLVHNPGNPHDRNAIEVRASTGLLGYLSREDAARYAPILATMQQNGLTAATTARVWGYDQENWDSGREEFVGSVRVDLPEPHMLAPANRPPTSAHQILPIGAAIQVTGEEDHRSATAPYLNPHGECWIYATLHEIVEQGPRTSKALAEVRIDGNPVGRLTPKMSADMLPVVNHLAEGGQATCVRAIVKGNQLKAEVVLYALRAHELPADWLASIADSQNAPASTAQHKSDVASPEGSRVVEPEPSVTTNDGPAAASPPAGWYPDPQGLARLRYWDGTQWTNHTSF